VAIVKDLYAAAQPIINAQLAHPFVRGLGDGTLDPQVFTRWVRQDYLYLIEYARVFGLAAARADRLDSMRWFAGVMHLTLATEMELHRRYASRFGISAGELAATPIWPTTRAYTNFLVRTAATGQLAEVVAAVLPCAWGYLEVASALARGESPEDARYAEWIAQYSAPEFVRARDWLELELERLAADAGPDQCERLRELFITSCWYELEFWEMCWRGRA